MASAATLINFKVNAQSNAGPTTPQETQTTTVASPNTGVLTKNQDGNIGSSTSLALAISCVIILVALIAIIKTGRSIKSNFCISKKKKLIADFVASSSLMLVACGALAFQILDKTNASASTAEVVFSSTENLSLELTAGESGHVCGELKAISATDDGFKIQSITNGTLIARNSDTNEIIGEVPSISKAGELSDNTWGVTIDNNSETPQNNQWQPISSEAEIFSIGEETSANHIVSVCYGIKTSTSLAPGNYEVTINYEFTANAPEEPVGLYRTNLYEQKTPKNLIVLLMNYNNSHYDISDEEIEAQWHDWVFGTGTIEDETASINDYLKEISNGQFYYNPILIGDNTTGVYSFHFDKEYSDEQFVHPEYAFFDFSYDMAQAMSQLADEGLDLSRFQADGIDNSNYRTILPEMYNAPQSFRDPQWYDTDTILCVFPARNTSNVSLAPIANTFDKFAIHVHLNVNDSSNFGTIAHELLHTIGTIDIYRFGSYADIMSDQYNRWPLTAQTYNTMHLNPYYKILYGWADAKVVSNSRSKLTLYPATSEKYNPVIIKTDDPNQYFILENRQPESFDRGIVFSSSNGVNVWRVDGLSMDKIYGTGDRKGLYDRVLQHQGDSYVPTYYENKTDVSDATEVTTGITIEYISSNADGSITISVGIPQ